MVDNSWEEVAPLVKKALDKGSLTKEEKTLFLRTLASKKHIQMDNKVKAKRELMEAEEALIETSILVDKINLLEVM